MQPPSYLPAAFSRVKVRDARQKLRRSGLIIRTDQAADRDRQTQNTQIKV